MENPPFIIHKFGYMRSSQIVKKGLTKPKSMTLALKIPQQKIVLESESFFVFKNWPPQNEAKNSEGN